ncbi:MAG: exodeoxyribonuclease VII small subunit, partial [Limosilactobacillus fermentum]|nr:exodeoxyribonuclease VII small subunit [Limosilactobacillus fermentum]
DENGQLHPTEEKGDDVSNNGVQNQGYKSQFLDGDVF